MRFAAPQVLWLLLALPLLALAGALAAQARRRSLRRFAGGPANATRFAASVSANRRATKALLLLLAAGSGIVAAARPQWGVRLEPITRRGVDVAVVLDTSLSMSAEDVPPNRLGQARHAAASLIRQLAGNRIALVTFAGRGTLACPLTLDYEAALLFLEAVDAEAVPIPGSAISDALRVAARAFGTNASEGRHRAVVLFSDGEDHEGGIDEAIAVMKEAGAAVYAVGCGTGQGAPIPLRESSADVSAGYKKDAEGRVVTTKLEEGVLAKLTLDTDGRYFIATPSEGEVDEIARAVAGMDAREFGTVLRTRYEERFQFPLALAIAALVAEALIGDRRSGAGRRPTRSAEGAS
jgi:Ca-activated chloride channel family protein